MKIKQILSIGMNCDPLCLTQFLNLRCKGPVDNLGGPLCYVENLFNGKFEKDLMTNNYQLLPYNKFDKLVPCTYVFAGYEMVHNDFRQSKVKREMLRRFNVFKQYIEEAKTNKALFFMLSSGWGDYNLTTEKIENELNKLPQYVRDRLLIIDGRTGGKYKPKNIPVFITDEKYLRHIHQDCYLNTHNLEDPLKEKNKVIQEYNEWWNEHKEYYENINNVKYDLLI